MSVDVRGVATAATNNMPKHYDNKIVGSFELDEITSVELYDEDGDGDEIGEIGKEPMDRIKRFIESNAELFLIDYLKSKQTRTGACACACTCSACVKCCIDKVDFKDHLIGETELNRGDWDDPVSAESKFLVQECMFFHYLRQRYEYIELDRFVRVKY